MTYSLEIINMFITFYAIDKLNISKISDKLNISRMTLYNWISKYDYFIKNKEAITEEIFNRINKKSYKLIHYENKIVDFVNKNEGCSLKDIDEHIDNELSFSSICRILKINGITKKRISNKISPLDEEKIIKNRITFSKQIINNQINEAFYLDETSFCISDYKRHGYSKKSKPIQKIRKHKHTRETLTVISLISIKKEILIKKIVKGTVNGQTYLDFIKENIDILKNETLIQDNARIHHSKIFKEYAKEKSINLIFNPPYTPEFNPIELVFRKAKILFRNIACHNNFEKNIEDCFNQITNKDITNFYKNTMEEVEKYRILD